VIQEVHLDELSVFRRADVMPANRLPEHSYAKPTNAPFVSVRETVFATTRGDPV